MKPDLVAQDFRCQVRVGGEPCGMRSEQMKRLAIAWLFGFWLTACGPEGSMEAASGDLGTEARGAVWVVEGKQGGRLYLCGTIHLLRDEDYPLATVYDIAYEQSEELIMELPPGAGQSPALAQRMAELGKLPAGEQLVEKVGEKDWQRVQEWAGKRGLGQEMVAGLRPWYLSLLMVALEYQRLGASPDQGVEQVYEERAKADGKPGKGLETVEFQLQLFAGMSEEQQKQVLQQTLDEIESVEVEFERMIRFWKEGNMDELQALLMREAERYPDLMEAFLVARNRAWLPQLEAVLAEQRRAMVLVGAGHLGGVGGLLDLFKQRGYRITHASGAVAESN